MYLREFCYVVPRCVHPITPHICLIKPTNLYPNQRRSERAAIFLRQKTHCTLYIFTLSNSYILLEEIIQTSQLPLFIMDILSDLCAGNHRAYIPYNLQLQVALVYPLVWICGWLASRIAESGLERESIVQLVASRNKELG